MRRNALGNFRTLLQEMSKDPAMMIWLDTQSSKKGKPNENYARELMELFSLGIGHYTEKDIREAARAFTGWEIDGGKSSFRIRRSTTTARRSSSARRGNCKGEDIVRHLPGARRRRVFHHRQAVPLPRQRDAAAGPRVARAAGRAVPQERLRPARAGRDDAALEPVLLAGSPIARRSSRRSISPSASSAAWKGTSAPSRWPRAGGLGAEALSPAVGQGLGRRHDLAQLDDALAPPEPGPGPDLDPGQPLRPPQTDPAPLVRKYGKKTDEEIVDFFVAVPAGRRAGRRPRELAGLPEHRPRSRRIPFTGPTKTPKTTAFGPFATWC